MSLPYDSSYSICKAIYKKLGGTEEEFDSTYTILLKTLPLVNGGGGSCPSYWTVQENVTIFPMTYDIYTSVFSDSPEEFISAYLWSCATDANLEYMNRGMTVYNVHSNIMQDLLPVDADNRDFYQTEWSTYIQEDLSNPDFFIFVSGISPIDDIETLTNDYNLTDYEVNWAIDVDKLPTDVVLTRDLKALAPDEYGKAIKTGEIPTPSEKPFRNEKWWRKEEETKEQPTKS